MKLKDLIRYLEQLSPVQYAEDWDNVGLLLGDDTQEVTRVMIALDATDYVVEQAVLQKVDVLLTHHPMIFKPVKQINNHSMVGRRLLKLAGHHIAYYAMHTNFDIKGGMAEIAARRIGLTDMEPLEVTAVEQGVPEGIGRVGHLPEAMTVREIAEDIKQKFGLKNVILYGNKSNKVWKIAICPGSGKSEIQNALAAGAELLITGDIGHHEGIDALDQGLMILDATHYGLEHIFIEFMAGYLSALQNQDLQIICMDVGSPIEVL
jgi:dinuclear metal center YbgI/SA1388 family protein